MTVTSDTPIDWSTSRLINYHTGVYPVFLSRIATLYANVSFPKTAKLGMLQKYGYALILPTDKPAGDVVTELDPVLVQSDGNGPLAYEQQWSVRSFTTEEVQSILTEEKAIRKQQLADARDASLETGMLYTFPNNSEEHVRLRIDDRVVLIGLRLMAREYLDIGDNTTTIVYRSEENNTHDLTPQQILDMTTPALAMFEELYKQSWTLSDSIESATSVEELPTIPSILTVN